MPREEVASSRGRRLTQLVDPEQGQEGGTTSEHELLPGLGLSDARRVDLIYRNIFHLFVLVGDVGERFFSSGLAYSAWAESMEEEMQVLALLLQPEGLVTKVGIVRSILMTSQRTIEHLFSGLVAQVRARRLEDHEAGEPVDTGHQVLPRQEVPLPTLATSLFQPQGSELQTPSHA